MIGGRASVMFCVLITFLIVSVSMADVICPVCGQHLDDRVKVCPNDGTDLTLVGGRTHEDSGDTDAKEEGPPSSLDADGEREGDDAPIRYKRHDEGGDRQIAPPKESSGFSDRESRLLNTERTRASSRPKRRHARSTKRSSKRAANTRVMQEFEKKRLFSWEKRENSRLLASMAGEDRETTQEKLLATLAAPLTSLGGRLLWLGEGRDSGMVGAAEIDVNLMRYRLRAGVSTLLGLRAMTGPNDLVFLESLNVGIQWPSRFSPYGIIRGGIGALLSNDGKSTNAVLVGTVGFDVGIDVWTSPWLVLTPSVGYMGNIRDKKYRNTFTAKIAIGF